MSEQPINLTLTEIQLAAIQITLQYSQHKNLFPQYNSEIKSLLEQIQNILLNPE